MKASIKRGFKHAMLVNALFCLLMMAHIMGFWDLDRTITRSALAAFTSRLFMTLATLWGMPLLWSYMLAWFWKDGTVTSEPGLVLHILYLAFGIALCLTGGIDICISMFLLYWPFSRLVRATVDPLFAWLFRDRS